MGPISPSRANTWLKKPRSAKQRTHRGRAIMKMTMTMEFDLENRLDDVVESADARDTVGTPGALLAYVPKVYSKRSNL